MRFLRQRRKDAKKRQKDRGKEDRRKEIDWVCMDLVHQRESEDSIGLDLTR